MTNATKIARINLLRNVYFSRVREDSPRRFIKRLLKPRQFRYQSLLRGAMAEKMKAKFPFVAGRRVEKVES